MLLLPSLLNGLIQKKQLRRYSLLIFILSFSCSLPSGLEKPNRPNILFISIDDLRPELGFYGHPYIHSPNLDSLSQSSLVFNRAYAQEPTCGPSRASLLSGLRPDSAKVFDIYTPIRTVNPDIVTLPQHFRESGYTTISLGKIFHHEEEDDSLGWSESSWKAPLDNLRGYLDPKNIERITAWGNSSYYEVMDVADSAYEDGMTANKAIATLNRLKQEDNPFFLAVGFFKPHLPFIAPKKYWDLYDSSQINLPEPYQLPNDRFVGNFNFGGEISSYLDATRRNYPWFYTELDGEVQDSIRLIDDATATRLIHGYRACMSYTDAQVGKVLAELNRLDLAENTIVVVWSDHGWLLGEMGDWCKHSLFEWQTRTTLMLRPTEKDFQGKETDAIVEMVDIYPTLTELAQLPPSPNTQGESFAHLLVNPDGKAKEAAFTQYPRDYYNETGLVGKRYYQGYTVRTDRYRCTQWRLSANLDSVVASELYDYRNGMLENKNIANDASYATELARHEQMIEEHFIKGQPKNKYAKMNSK